jgi:hypothetical protein
MCEDMQRKQYANDHGSFSIKDQVVVSLRVTPQEI